MNITLFWPTQVKLSFSKEFVAFSNAMIARLTVGWCRYGEPAGYQLYLTRLEKELARYKQTGNREGLMNIANYAFLESLYPEHPKYHFNPLAKSATRKGRERER
jgi:hypothetical protein